MNKHSEILAETALWVGLGSMVYHAFKKPRQLSRESVIHSSHMMSLPDRRGSSYCNHCGGDWDGVTKTYQESLEGPCVGRSQQPMRTVHITLSPAEKAFFADVRKHGLQQAYAAEKARAKQTGKASAPVAPRQAQPVHIRRIEGPKVDAVAAAAAMKPKSQADLMDVLVRLRDWLAYWEVKDIEVAIEGACVICRVKSQANWSRVSAMWAKDISVVLV